ncbi:MAG: hypothetical protein ACFBSE_26090 [Prochloraceae cyanobacterium]
MSDLNIYLADGVKERMSEFDRNWSAICRKAIEAELSRLEAERDTNMKSNKSQNWVAKRLKPETFDNAVIKPYSAKNEVKMMSNFYDTLVSELGNARLYSLGCQLSQLLNEESQVEILFPSKDWQLGNLQLDFQLYFKYPE